MTDALPLPALDETDDVHDALVSSLSNEDNLSKAEAGMYYDPRND